MSEDVNSKKDENASRSEDSEKTQEDYIKSEKTNRKPADKRITIIKDVIIHPVQAFREIDENSNVYLPAAIVIFLISGGFFSEGFLEGRSGLAGRSFERDCRWREGFGRG